jgi:hypothetical protein
MSIWRIPRSTCHEIASGYAIRRREVVVNLTPRDYPRNLGDLAHAAFQRMAGKVLERARQTGTPVVVWKDDRVTELPAEQIAENRTPKTENHER